MTAARLEAGSFRDRDGRVFYQDDRVYRALSAGALDAYRAVAGTAFFPRAMAARRVVTTHEVEDAAAMLAALGDGAPWAGALEHERVPFVSYPYEWSFTMLRDAALLQLALLREALGERMTMKDASSYNVQFVGARPVFVDVASFEPWRKGDPWVGYLQFCQLFLYPLLLTAYRDVPFQPFLRGAIDGISPEVAARLFSLRDRLRPGVLAHAVLQAKLQERTRDATTSTRRQLRRAGFRREMILHNVRRLERLVGSLEWGRSRSTWGDYVKEHSYDDASLARKRAFVEAAAAERRRELVWDLGANTGAFSRLAAPHAATVVAFDGDHLAVERMYRELQADGPANVLPLVADLVDPSPAIGWRLRERRASTDRGRPDLVLALALVHHLVIGKNVPLAELVAWLAELGANLVVEWVERRDPMVEKLLLDKEDVYHDYSRELFERLVGERFDVVRREELLGGSRVLYYGRPRAGRGTVSTTS